MQGRVSNDYTRRVAQFLNRLGRGIGAPELARLRARRMVDDLLLFDPHRLTQFEFSFKLGKAGIGNTLRFLNLDADSYSCKSPSLYRARLEAFEEVMGQGADHPGWSRLREALEGVAPTPMDLYFGADLPPVGPAVFGFWLIFGGVKRSGSVSFCPHDLRRILGEILSRAGCQPPRNLRDDILNLGFDFSACRSYYKVYYLCRGKSLASRSFSPWMRSLNRALSAFDFFFFYSEMYDAGGRLIKEKLFIEFLEDVAGDGARVRPLLAGLATVERFQFDPQATARLLGSCRGRISLVSLEAGGTTTLYLRP